MLSMTILFLFLSSIHFAQGIPFLDYYLPSPGDHNVLRLECLENDQAQTTAIFRIHNRMDRLIRERITDSGRDYLTYNITEDFEVLIHCVIEGEPSAASRFVGN